MEEDPNAVLLDVRNRYESEAGRFENAVVCEIEHFRELPGYVEQLADLKGKARADVLHRWIRCEKASALFRQRGFQNVHQLQGGIVSYQEQFGNEHWLGECFVFDQRMTVGGGRTQADRPLRAYGQRDEPVRELSPRSLSQTFSRLRSAERGTRIFGFARNAWLPALPAKPPITASLRRCNRRSLAAARAGQDRRGVLDYCSDVSARIARRIVGSDAGGFDSAGSLAEVQRGIKILSR